MPAVFRPICRVASDVIVLDRLFRADDGTWRAALETVSPVWADEYEERMSLDYRADVYEESWLMYAEQYLDEHERTDAVMRGWIDNNIGEDAVFGEALSYWQAEAIREAMGVSTEEAPIVEWTESGSRLPSKIDEVYDRTLLDLVRLLDDRSELDRLPPERFAALLEVADDGLREWLVDNTPSLVDRGQPAAALPS